MTQPIASGCASVGHTGLTRPVLREIASLLKKLAKTGECDAIDLRSLPMSNEDRYELETALGRGEVHANVMVAGDSEVWETFYPGVWWVRHFGANHEIASETILITDVPDILKSDAEDIKRAAVRLDADLIEKEQGTEKTSDRENAHE